MQAFLCQWTWLTFPFLIITIINIIVIIIITNMIITNVVMQANSLPMNLVDLSREIWPCPTLLIRNSREDSKPDSRWLTLTFVAKVCLTVSRSTNFETGIIGHRLKSSAAYCKTLNWVISIVYTLPVCYFAQLLWPISPISSEIRSLQFVDLVATTLVTGQLWRNANYVIEYRPVADIVNTLAEKLTEKVTCKKVGP